MRSRILFLHCFTSVLIGQVDQATFITTEIAGSLVQAESIFLADIDNDGDLDVVSATEDDKIHWHENDGAADPSFTANLVVNNKDGIFTVVAADMDNDGDVDIVSASKYDDKITWFENDGESDPSFTTIDIANSADNPVDVFVLDMDNDGDMDILSVSVRDDALSWYENDGASDPTWTASDIYTGKTVIKSGLTSVFAADMDNDGDMDILTSSEGGGNNNTISLFKNDGAADPSWSKVSIAFNAGADHVEDIFAADMDNDGDMDILFVAKLDKALGWYKNDGASNPSWSSSDWIDTNVGNPTSVFAADMDNDGDMDILVTENNNDRAVFYENDGASNPSWSSSNIKTGVPGLRSAVAGDIDNDGDLDALTISHDAQKIYLHENMMEKGMIASWSAAVITESANGAFSVFATDIDNDGDMDILSASASDDKIAWYENDGIPNPSNPIPNFTTNVITTNADGAKSVYAADIDNDGDMDILSASAEDRKIAWYENDGARNPSFTSITITTDANGAFSVYATDIDNDGDMDVLSASENDDKIAWYENDGSTDPSFTARTITTGRNEPESVYAADVDGDGDMDVLSASEADDNITWFENDGATDPSFTARTITTRANGASSVYAADLDNDGDMDVLSASSYDNKVSWYENDGARNPSFTERTITTDADGSWSVYAVDVDNDGDMDVLSASPGNDRVAWYENDGTTDPSFTARTITTDANGAYSVYAADLDNDGDMDVLSASYNDNTIAWYENLYDATVPTVISVSSTNDNGNYKIGDVIAVTLELSEAATVTTVNGTPRIKLETGTTDQYATYASGSATTTLTFNYTVAAGDTTANLDYASTSALELNSGTIKDISGNAATLTLVSPGASGSLGANKAIVIDGNVPMVSSVTSSKEDGIYKTVGEIIPITVKFNQLVNVTGTPQLTLETDTTDAIVDYSSGSGTAMLTFNYVIAEGHTNYNLDYVSTSALALNSGAINDASGNIAILTLSSPGSSGSLGANKAIIIDPNPPTFVIDPIDGSTAIAVSSNITFTFNEMVRNIDGSALSNSNIDGLITLKNNNSNGDDIPFDASVNESKSVITIDPASDFISDQYIYVAIGASLEDSVGHPIIASNSTFRAPDIIIPTVTFDPANGSQNIAANRNITLTFSEPIRNIDNSEITASNVGELIVLKGNNSSGADFNFGASINADKTVITIDPLFDFSANSTVYVGIGQVVEDKGDNAIPASSSIFMTGVPDVTGPKVINVSSNTPNGTYTENDRITISVEFDEVAVVEGIPQIKLETGATDGIANYSTGSGTKTLDFIYTISDQHNTSDLDYKNSNSLILNGGLIKDFVDNNANLALSNPGAEGSLGFNKDIVIDNIGPSVTAVSSSTEDGAYKAGEIIVISVSFNEITTVIGTPKITLETGAADGVGVYSSGSGSTVLSFNYTVEISHNSPDLAYTSTTALNLYGGTIKDRVGLNADLILPVPGQPSSLSSNKNIVIDNIAPTISTSSVQDNGVLPVLADSKIIFTTSEAVTSAKINLQSSLGDSPSASLKIDDPTHVSVNLTAPFTSGDELNLTINELTDYAGNITNGLVYNYTISLISDFNTDGSIDAADMTVLINGWSNKDYAYELGPTTGDVPNLKPALDGKFDIMDAAVLIRMWHWNLNKSGKILARYINTGTDLEYNNEDNTLSISIADNVNAVDFYLKYPQDEISINQATNNSSDKEIVLSHSDSLRGEYIITAGYLEEMDRSLQIPYLIKSRGDVKITAIYRMFDKNSVVSKQGTKEITLKAIPQEFSLHQNYPNPFNPTTTINFDLPNNTHIAIAIYDINGRLVTNLFEGIKNAGYHSVPWGSRNQLGGKVAAGIYFYQLQSKEFVKTRKMILLK
tara:strand:+ start:1632 stop:7229 length:5598 start_codon:yes stop_codon:yes gene_type:complete